MEQYNSIVMMVCAHIIAFLIGRKIAMNKCYLDKISIKLQLIKEVLPLRVKEKDKNFAYGKKTIREE